jgi:GT2 family glycosyltransferase
MSETRATCVIVAYHRPDSLRSLLAALDAPNLERIVGNGEAVTEVWGAGGTPTGRDLLGNPGFAAGINCGAARATAPVIVFMNDDLRADATTIAELVGAIERGADAAIPAVIAEDGTVERTIAPLPTPAALARDWMLLPDEPVRGLSSFLRVEKWRVPADGERVPAATAAMVAVRADVLRAVPVPEEYFLYWEESAWFYELAQRGMRTVFVRNAEIRHAGWRDDVRVQKSELLARNAVRCVRRTQGRTAAGFAWPIVVVWQLRLLVTAWVRAALGRGDRAVSEARLAGLRAALLALREVR